MRLRQTNLKPFQLLHCKKQFLPERAPKVTLRRLNPQKRWLVYLVLGVFSALISTMPVTAAERIYFIYSPLSLSLRVQSLELFAKQGEVNQDLQFYFDRIGTSQQEQEAFRQALLEKAQLEPVLLSRLFNSDIGEALLDNFGKIINIQGGRNGKYALRAALIQAAFEPEGLTLLNFLKKLPVNMQIDLSQARALSKAFKTVVRATTEFTADIAELSQQEALATPALNFSTLTDLRQPGSYGVQKRKLGSYLIKAATGIFMSMSINLNAGYQVKPLW